LRRLSSLTSTSFRRATPRRDRRYCAGVLRSDGRPESTPRSGWRAKHRSPMRVDGCRLHSRETGRTADLRSTVRSHLASWASKTLGVRLPASDLQWQRISAEFASQRLMTLGSRGRLDGGSSACYSLRRTPQCEPLTPGSSSLGLCCSSAGRASPQPELSRNRHRQSLGRLGPSATTRQAASLDRLDHGSNRE